MPRAKANQKSLSPTPVFNFEDSYYNARELSRLLNVSMGTLADYRRKGIGPQYISVGYRSCRYAKTEVLKYIEERTRASTSATRNYDL